MLMLVMVYYVCSRDNPRPLEYVRLMWEALSEGGRQPRLAETVWEA